MGEGLEEAFLTGAPDVIASRPFALVQESKVHTRLLQKFCECSTEFLVPRIERSIVADEPQKFRLPPAGYL